MHLTALDVDRGRSTQNVSIACITHYICLVGRDLDYANTKT
jgi:hypothetical protein